MLKVLVCGFGSIGRKHAINLKALGAEVKIWRARSGMEDDEAFSFVSALSEGIQWCDAVVIATATDQHISIALEAAKMGKALYIEKPLSHNNQDIENLANLCRNLVVEVGCQLRFHPNIQFLRKQIIEKADGEILSFQAWVGQRLDQWRPGSNYSQGYSAQRERGGGALFDLVHEIDLIVWICGGIETVSADLRRVGDLKMEADNLANLILTTKNGASGVIQLDMISPAYRRGMSIVCERAVYMWDYTRGEITRADANGTVVINTVSQGFEAKNLLRDCMAYFLERCRNPSLPASCSLSEGIHDLDVLLAAESSNSKAARQTL